MLDAMAALPEVIPPGEGTLLDVLGAPMRIRLDTDGVFLAEHEAPPGYAVPLHVHAEDDEVFWILDGTLTVSGERGTSLAGPGTCVRLPRGGAHAFRNDSAAPVRFLVMCVPGRQGGAMFRALAAARAPTPEAVAAICAAHGVRFV